jgi:hypothetical protein
MTIPWKTVAFALLLTASVTGLGSAPAEAQRYRGDRDWDEDRRGDWDDDRRRPGFRFEFGNRDRDRRCHWVSRRYVDEDGDVEIRRRRVCD